MLVLHWRLVQAYQSLWSPLTLSHEASEFLIQWHFGAHSPRKIDDVSG